MAEQIPQESTSPTLAKHLEAALVTPRRYLNEDEFDDLVDAFEDSDDNADGFVTREEFAAARERFSIAEDELDALRGSLELTPDGRVSLAEVLALRAHAKIRERAELIRTSFTTVDTNADGLIDLDELAAFMVESGAGDVQAERDHMLAMLDVDGDSQISLDEFLGYNLDVAYPPLDGDA